MPYFSLLLFIFWEGREERKRERESLWVELINERLERGNRGWMCWCFFISVFFGFDKLIIINKNISGLTKLNIHTFLAVSFPTSGWLALGGPPRTVRHHNCLVFLTLNSAKTFSPNRYLNFESSQSSPSSKKIRLQIVSFFQHQLRNHFRS